MSGTKKRINRRELGKIALVSAAALDTAQSGPAQTARKYASALDGAEDKVNMAAFDPVLFTKKLHDAAPLRLTFRAQTRDAAEHWQKIEYINGRMADGAILFSSGASRSTNGMLQD